MHEKLKNIELLYVEDEEDIRTQMTRFLSKKVKTIHLAGNGEEGFQLFTQTTPDLIITDIRMPILEGVQMISKIREANPDIPVIFVTACDEDSGLLQSDTHNCKTIQKPINVFELLNVMVEMI